MSSDRAMPGTADARPTSLFPGDSPDLQGPSAEPGDDGRRLSGIAAPGEVLRRVERKVEALRVIGQLLGVSLDNRLPQSVLSQVRSGDPCIS